MNGLGPAGLSSFMYVCAEEKGRKDMGRSGRTYIHDCARISLPRYYSYVTYSTARLRGMACVAQVVLMVHSGYMYYSMLCRTTKYNYYTRFTYPNFVHSESFLVLGPQRAVERKVMCDGGGPQLSHSRSPATFSARR